MPREYLAADAYSDEVQLRRCLRDLTALTALPALWKGRSPQEIAESLAGVLRSILRLDFVFVRARSEFTAKAIEVAHSETGGPPINTQELEELVTPFSEGSVDLQVLIRQSLGLGDMQVIVSSIGCERKYGLVVVGSRAAAFPTISDRLLLDVAINQAAISLEAVELQMREQAVRAEAEGRRRLLEAVLSQMPAGVVIASAPYGEIILTNKQAAAELLEHPIPDSLKTALGVRTFRPEADQPEDSPLARSLFGGEVVIGKEGEYVRSDGKRCQFVANSAPIRDEAGQIVAAVLAFQDITEVRQAQEELLHRRQNDTMLAERMRIARELHDTLLQGLSGVTMQMQALSARLLPSAEKRTLQEIIHDATACQKEARQSIFALRDTSATQSGLIAALEQAAHQIVASSGIRFGLQLERLALPSEAQSILLRIAQEALTNAVRHSGANSIEIILHGARQGVVFSVRDNGHGFVPVHNNLEAAGHYGIIGMKERAEQIGAELKVMSELGKGTEVTVLMPVRYAGNPSDPPS
jgi:signal transduction histidine kinase